MIYCEREVSCNSRADELREHRQFSEMSSYGKDKICSTEDVWRCMVRFFVP